MHAATSGARRGMARCAIAAVLFGASAPAASQLAGELSAFTLAGVLYVGAALAVVPLIVGRRPPPVGVRRAGARLAIAVFVGGAVGPVLLIAGLARTSAGSASLLLNLELVFTTVLAGVVFREYLGRRMVLGTIAVLIASGVLGWTGTGGVGAGTLLIAAACLCWAVDNCVTAGLDEFTPAQITFVKGIVAGTANLAIGLVTAGVPATGPVLGALVVGALGYGISITLWVAGARDLGAARAQLVFATAPFFGAAVAWTVLGEALTSRQLIAVVIAALGIAVVVDTAHRHRHRHEPVEHDHEHGHDDGHHDHSHSAGPSGRHAHRHAHLRLVHAHPHVPDVHHRHDHE